MDTLALGVAGKVVSGIWLEFRHYSFQSYTLMLDKPPLKGTNHLFTIPRDVVVLAAIHGGYHVNNLADLF